MITFKSNCFIRHVSPLFRFYQYELLFSIFNNSKTSCSTCCDTLRSLSETPSQQQLTGSYEPYTPYYVKSHHYYDPKKHSRKTQRQRPKDKPSPPNGAKPPNPAQTPKSPATSPRTTHPPQRQKANYKPWRMNAVMRAS